MVIRYPLSPRKPVARFSMPLEEDRFQPPSPPLSIV